MAKVSLRGYGQNQSAVPSSLTPDQGVDRSPYAPPLSNAHESVISRGVASNPQIRKIDTRSEANVPAAHGMRERAETARVPSKTIRL